MALEAVVFAQGRHFGYGPWRDSPYTPAQWCDVAGGGDGFDEFFGDWDHQLAASVVPNAEEWEADANSTEGKAPPEPAAAAGRKKRSRTKVVKNKEEIESQRMTHIAVERNRRIRMNEYLAVLRSLMPPSYARRGDQASIVGGAVNYVKELEQHLQSLEVQKCHKNRAGRTDAGHSPFASFFSFPQYSTSSHGGCGATSTGSESNVKSEAAGSAESARTAAVADIEVTMVEGHASLKVLTRRRPKQLLKLVVRLQQLLIPPLHLNMTSVDAMVLYSFSLKVEDDSKLRSVEDIATAVHEILGSIQRQEEEAGLSSGASACT